MKALQSVWNTLESSVFRFSPSKASSAIFLVIITQLAISVPMLFLLYNIKALAGASEEMAAIATGAGRCIFISYAGLLIITVLSLCIWKMIGYLATKPLRTVDAIFHRMVDGQADWSEDLKSLPYPELKHVSTGYNTLMNDLRNIIEEMRKAGIRIAIGSAHVHKAVNLAGQKANEQKEISGLVAASSDDSSTAIHEISGNTNYVSQNTSTNLNQVRTSFNELENVAQKVESINRTMTNFSETIEELNRNSAGIMEIIAVINDMSDQTNLLSLNATIEAARAGEYGKGFAVVAEEVRSLAKQIKPATEDISEKISQMIATVDKTKAESNTIIDASMEVNTIISETAGNFESMIGDFEETNEQLLKIAAAIEELSLTNEEINKKVTDINTLSNEVFIDMESSEKKVQEFAEITEEMQDKAAHYRTGRGTLDRVILLVQRHRDHMQEVLSKLSQQGVNIFDENYRPIPDTNPAKFTTAFTDPLRKEIQEYVDTTLKEIPGCIYCIPVDRKGYLAVHHSHVSKPITGDYEKDLLQSRHMRFFFSTRTDQRRVTSTAPMLLQTYMRDTGEVLNDLSMPITINGRHWGGYIVGLLPEVLTE